MRKIRPGHRRLSRARGGATEEKRELEKRAGGGRLLRHRQQITGKKPGHSNGKRARGGNIEREAEKLAHDVKEHEEDEGDEGRAKGGKLTAARRQALPKSDFALPGHGKGPKGAGAGSYPIPDESHARNALARVSQHGSSEEKARVRAAVHRKFPGIGPAH